MKFSPNTFFTLFLVAFLLALALTNVTQDIVLSFTILLVVWVLFWYFIFYFRHLFYCLIYIVFWCILWIYISSYSYWKIDINFNTLDKYYWQYIQYEWEVIWVHKKSDFYNEYHIELRQLSSLSIGSDIAYIVRLPKNYNLQPGQYISHDGKLNFYEDFDSFSYKNYMLSQRLYFYTSSLTVDILSHNKWWSYKLYLYREKLLSNISNIFPEREAIFLWWILLWARENIPPELKEDFNNSWLTHFIAVSGFNITICIIFITFIFWFLPVWWRIIMVCCSIVLFAIFVWLGAPVVRASIMWILWYLFLQSGMTQRNITILAFTAFCMAIMSPLSLNFDVSLHLSFLAVIWIIYTQDFFKKVFYFMPEIFAIKEAFILTLSALTFALPIMLFQFWQVSILAPFSNIAVTWTIPIAMLLGTITIIMDFFSDSLTQIFWFLTWILLHYDMKIVHFFWNLEWSVISLDFWAYKYYFQIIYFILLIYVVSLYNWIKKKQL